MLVSLVITDSVLYFFFSIPYKAHCSYCGNFGSGLNQCMICGMHNCDQCFEKAPAALKNNMNLICAPWRPCYFSYTNGHNMTAGDCGELLNFQQKQPMLSVLHFEQEVQLVAAPAPDQPEKRVESALIVDVAEPVSESLVVEGEGAVVRVEKPSVISKEISDGGVLEGKSSSLEQRAGFEGDLNEDVDHEIEKLYTSRVDDSGVALQPATLRIDNLPKGVHEMVQECSISSTELKKQVNNLIDLPGDCLRALGKYDCKLAVDKLMPLDYYVNVVDSEVKLDYFGAARAVCTLPGDTFRVSSIHSVPTGSPNPYIPEAGLVYGDQVLFLGMKNPCIFFGAHWVYNQEQVVNFVPSKEAIFLTFGHQNKKPNGQVGDAVMFMSTFQEFLDNNLLGPSTKFQSRFTAFPTSIETACIRQFAIFVENQ
jgi:hypothetical protein